jgi:hypothetical protein
VIPNLLIKAFIQLENTSPHHVANAFIDILTTYDNAPIDINQEANSTKEDDHESEDNSISGTNDMPGGVTDR